MTMSQRTETLQFAVAISQETDPAEAGQALAESIAQQIGHGRIDLAFLFLSAHYAPQAQDLATAVHDRLAPSVLLGCTGEGIIAGGEEIETAAAVTLWVARLPGVQLTPLRLVASPEGSDCVRGWPEHLGSASDTPVFFLLADPFSTPMNEVLSLISERCPGASAIGGLAGGGQDFGANRMLLNGEVFDRGLVGVALAGPVSVRTVISQGCRPIGDRYVVTRSEHNVIHELSGKPALEQLQSVFASLSADEQRLAHRALHIGIAIDEHREHFERGDFLVRNLIGADRKLGTLAIGDMVQEGQTVQFQVRDAQSASEDLGSLIANDRVGHTHPPLGALLFSCCARGHSLFGQPNHDIGVIREQAGSIPVAGFFAQGEIGPVSRHNFVHGYTASVALFSEPGP